MAPRGLITILLFLSVAQSDRVDIISTSLVIQIVIITALIMMFGLMRTKRTVPSVIPMTNTQEPISEESDNNAAQ
mgnify:FL=1